MSMTQQLGSFARTVQQMIRVFRGDAAAAGNYLNKCIFYSGLGSNDYLNNYYMNDYYSTSSDYTPSAYAAALIQDYSKQLIVPCISSFIFNDLLQVFVYEYVRMRVCVVRNYTTWEREKWWWHQLDK